MNWKEFLKDTNNNFKHLAKEIPETFSGFASMGNLPKKDGALDRKTKEFIALGIAIATRCDSCIGFHTRYLVDLGVTRGQFTEALSMCSYMGGGPSISYSAKALAAFDEFSEKK